MPADPNPKQLHRIVDGRMLIDEETVVPGEAESKWASLVQNLLPEALPAQVHACSQLLNNRFRGCLPPGVTQAEASLSALCFEQQARALLVDFLTTHHDAVRLYRRLRLQLLFRERTESAKEAPAAIPSPLLTNQSQPLSEKGFDWEWVPLQEGLEAPDVDDSSLRIGAARLQESIGSYSTKESGAIIPGLKNLADAEIWAQVEPSPADKHEKKENILLERTAKLGKVALELLEYFASNPGDKAVHVENVLGYPASEINRLLLGSLGHYVKRSGSGGWECHPWVIDLLSALDETRRSG